MSITRRAFVQSSAVAGLLSAAPAIATAQKSGKTYRTALVGTGWWGTNILREEIRSEACKIVALCDVDENQSKKCLGEVATLTSETPKTYGDYREMIESEKPEIVI